MSKPQKLTPAQLDAASMAAWRAGNMVHAMQLCGDALKMQPSNDALKQRYAYFIESLEVKNFDPEIKKSITLCLKYDALDHQKLAIMWASLLNTAPLYAFLFDDTLEGQKYWRAIDTLLNDDFFIDGLRKLNPSNAAIEKALIRLRRTLLMASTDEGRLRTKHLPLLAALATHCFYNEYVWPETPDEKTIVDALTPSDPITIALAGTYRPLMEYQDAPTWLDVYNKGPLADTLRAQVQNPLLERAIKTEIQSFSPIEQGTSQDVQAMYEENPYPRWRRVEAAPHLYTDVALDWLTAGCGTGRPLTLVASTFPNARLTAIDLSRASMAYAIRKTREAGATHIDFRHGDILNVGALGKDFDFIESSGVLHHMKDPIEGWKRLLDCLRPGGRMQIGLYSAAARDVILKVRTYIKEKAYPPTQDGIRTLRQDMMALPDDHPLKPITKRRDFFTTSECRDLVFHIQEENYTIPEIAAILDRLGLAFLGFKLPPATQALYQQRFPTDPLMRNLDNWHRLEQENPLFFIGMYNFFCCRKSEIETPREAWSILERTQVLHY